MVCDLLVSGGTLVSSREVRPGDVAVVAGRVAAVVEPGTPVSAAETIDARGLHVLPGVIDTHVHTRHPGVPQREDFASGTAAAAAGGITTLFEMPIAKLPTNSADALTRRAALLQADARIDFALYGGAGHENLAAIAGQADAGAVAFKTFLQPPPPARLDEFHGLWCTDVVALREVMRAVAATGRRHCFHCEYTPAFEVLQRRLVAAGRLTGRAHADSRPAFVEDVSVAMVLALAAELGARVQVVHCSSARAAGLAGDARGRGVDVTVETCPPYLFFTDEALERLGPYAKCNPPLRSAAERDALREAVRAGRIDVIGTDHSPFLAADKDAGADNIFLAPPGLAGLEMLVPLMLTAVAEGWLGLGAVAALLSENAARIFHLPGKGRIAAGADADLTLVDLGAAWTYDHRSAITRSRDNMRIYDGLALRGRVVHTLVRGVAVYRDGEVVGRPGHGRLVAPAPDR